MGALFDEGVDASCEPLLFGLLDIVTWAEDEAAAAAAAVADDDDDDEDACCCP